MLIAYSVSTMSNHTGVIEVTPKEYEQLHQMDEVDQGLHVMECTNWGEESTLEFRHVECVSHFAPVSAGPDERS